MRIQESLVRVQGIEETVLQIMDVSQRTGRSPAYTAQERVRRSVRR
jgi:hypothetical protein